MENHIIVHCQVNHDTDIRGGGNDSNEPENDTPRRKRKAKLARKRKKSSSKKGKSHDVPSSFYHWCQ